MRDIKRITIDHKGLPFFDEDGVYVSYEDYAKLEDRLARSDDYSVGVDMERMEYITKCDALAMENAALIHFALGLYYPDGTSAVNENDLVKIPATAAYLNSVRAEGVDMFALYLAETAIKEGADLNGWKSTASNEACDYAAQLRAGKDGE